MISIEIERDRDGKVCAFTAQNHGASDVCAAVSLMVINTVNSIEALTKQDFTCDYKQEGGFIRYQSNGTAGAEAALLLDAMVLGLESVKERYQDENEEVMICYR